MTPVQPSCPLTGSGGRGRAVAVFTLKNPSNEASNGASNDARHGIFKVTSRLKVRCGYPVPSPARAETNT